MRRMTNEKDVDDAERKCAPKSCRFNAIMTTMTVVRQLGMGRWRESEDVFHGR